MAKLALFSMLAIWLTASGARAQSEVAVADLQSMLNWTGHLTSPGSGVWDEDTVSALRQFQSSVGERPAGEVTREVYAKLSAAAQRERQKVGFEMVSDAKTGVEIGIPTRLVTRQGSATWGTNWRASNSTLDIDSLAIPFTHHTPESLHEKLRDRPGRTIIVDRMKGSQFMLEGDEGGSNSLRVFATSAAGEIRGYSIVYRRSMRRELLPLLNAISSSFRADVRVGHAAKVAIVAPSSAPWSPALPPPAASMPSVPSGAPTAAATPAAAPLVPPVARPAAPASLVEISQRFHKLVEAGVGDHFYISNADIDDRGGIAISLSRLAQRADAQNPRDTAVDLKGDANHLFAAVDAQDRRLTHLLFQESAGGRQLVLYTLSHPTDRDATKWVERLRMDVETLAQITGRVTDPLREFKQSNASGGPAARQ